MYGLFVRYKVPDWLPLIKVGLLPKAIEVRNVPTETSREVRQICFGMMVRGSAKRIVLRNAKFWNCCVLDHTPPDFSSPGIFGGEENLEEAFTQISRIHTNSQKKETQLIWLTIRQSFFHLV